MILWSAVYLIPYTTESNLIRRWKEGIRIFDIERRIHLNEPTIK